MTQMSLGEELRSLRLAMGRTQKQQSEIFGVSVNTMYRWENDLTVPRKSALTKMAEYYGVAHKRPVHG